MNPVSVRHLCEFAARSGSLDFRYTPAPTALEGMQGHQWLQSQYTGYSAEFPLSGEFAGVSLRGRSDLCKLAENVTSSQPENHDPASIAASTTTVSELIEIKTFRGRLERINPGQRDLHWAQLQVYGAMLCQQYGLKQVLLTLVYLNVDNKSQHPDSQLFTPAELFEEAQQICQRWYQWQQQEQAHRQQRNDFLQQLRFLDTGFRAGQKDLSETVYKATCLQARLLLEAPTGLGKTLGVIFPTLKAMPRQQIDRLFFLTARTTGRQLALDSLAQLLPPTNPAPIRVLELIAREKACEYPDKSCHGESCPLADGFFDRLPDARQQAVERRWLNAGEVKKIAAAHHICPYFLSQELAKWSDLIIGDVNHYFDDSALLHALTVEHQWRVSVLIDEAHNLIDRARGMYSTRLDQQQFDELRKPGRARGGLRPALQEVQKGWQQLEEFMFPEPAAFAHLETTLAEQPGDSATSNDEKDNGIKSRFSDELPDFLTRPISNLAAMLAKTLVDTPDDPHLQQALFACLGFSRLAERYAAHSVIEVGREQYDSGQLWASQQLSLTIHNLIPADFLRPRFEDAWSVVLFSATLQPSEYYRDLLGLPEDTVDIQVSGPFHKRQLQLAFPDINTRYAQREASIDKLALTLLQNHQQRQGNHLVFFSSFSYLHAVARAIGQLDARLKILKQQSDMSERQRQGFIRKFRHQRGLLAFAVLGGVFSEGIDLPGDELIAVSVVTLGLPPADRLHKILEQRIKQRFGEQHGWNYTWLYPGMRKVVQAAGRLIRTPEDFGWIDLIDPRFSRPEVRALLPKWWFEEHG
ncbi:ATP-dependent DNA helicase [Oceanobacter mangrovi]|uniref:ATP-dependent DNA helicase n=1 Tax=Oceanobacter mangrovi TaxID=2862510 RepID=UPI001C8D15A4|nr:ATP-dependent DNA helicase [Oceanobacter mangrovi]